MLGDLAGLAPGAVGLINMLILRGLDDLGRAVSSVPSSAPLRFCIHTLSLLHARLRGLEVVRSESVSKPRSANGYGGYWKISIFRPPLSVSPLNDTT